MGPNIREQYLSQIATELCSRMSEISELRKAIRLAEAAQALQQSAVPDPFLAVRGWASFR